MAFCDLTAVERNFVFSDGFKNKSMYSKKKIIAMAFFHLVSSGNPVENYESEFTSVSKKYLEMSYKISKRYNDTNNVEKYFKKRFPVQSDLSAFYRRISGRDDLRLVF